MDGSQLIHWTEDADGVRTYFGPRWTGEREPDQAALSGGRVIDRWDWGREWDRLWMDDFDERIRRHADELRNVWTPNGMRPR